MCVCVCTDVLVGLPLPKDNSNWINETTGETVQSL